MRGRKRRLAKRTILMGIMAIKQIKPRTVGKETVRLQYQVDASSPAVLFGREIYVKMDASRRQKIPVTVR